MFKSQPSLRSEGTAHLSHDVYAPAEPAEIGNGREHLAGSVFG